MNLRAATRQHRRALRKWILEYGIPGKRRRRWQRVALGQSFSSNDIDLKLMAHLSRNGGYFIELGANDGIAQSNTYLLEARYGWRGLLIEAVPHKYFQCRENRSPQNDYYCAAVVDRAYRDRFVEMHYSNLMSVGETSCLPPADHSEEGRRFLSGPEEIISFGAPAKTLTQILDDVSAPTTIDFMSLDVEGAEASVLRGIDFSRYSFGHLLIECWHREELVSILADEGYRVVEQMTERDYLFKPVSAC